MNKKNNWFYNINKDSDVVMSSRIRLARNIKNFKFLNRLSSEEKQKIILQVKDIFENINLGKDKNLKFIDMNKVSNISALSLAERHLISYDMATKPKDRAVFLSEDETISVMVNEEDHIRLQVFSNNFDIYDIYNQAQKIDSLLDERLKYSFDSELGYLTECITNIGTGMRVSVLLHLLALDRCGAINKLSNTLSKMGFIIRGSFGEGSEVKGAFYQISNQVTLGLSETTVIENLKSVVSQIMAQERATRSSLIKNDINFQDTIMRAFGVIKYSKVINYEEFIELASLVRVGICGNLITEIDLKTINYLINNLGPANISNNQQSELLAFDRDIIRAAVISQNI
ncbi:MAG: ATP--guanido phosphotransferase [Oscillospiraceae bacterium]|nr:ATP--guanido phosphotransferase [Oscillospiraceae bacterium]